MKRSDTTVRQSRLRQVGSGFRALHVRNYRLYWVGQLISQIGSWMQSTAQAWLVYKLTNSPFALGLVTTLQFLPMMLFSLFGGVIADRLPKRRLLLMTQTAFLVQAAVFGALVGTGVIQVWHIYVLSVLQGLVNVVDNPVRQAFPVELVPREDVGNAVALNSMTFNAARIMGPSLAGLVIAAMGIAPALYINAISFIAMIVALLMMNPADFHIRPPRPRQAAWYELKEGLSYAVKTPAILTIFIVVAAIGTFGYNFSTVLPLLGGFVLHTDAAGFGALSSAFGIGSFIGATFVAYSGEVTIRRLFIGAAAFTATLGALSLARVIVLSEVILIMLGVAGILFTTTANTLLQINVPDDLRGRVMSLYVLFFIGSTPVGAFLTGTMATAFSVPVALGLEALVCLIGMCLALVYYRMKVQAAQAPAS